MRYTKQSFSAILVGERYGVLWAGYTARVSVNKVLNDNKNNLRYEVRKMLSQDFESAYLSPDSYVMVTLIKFNRRITRYFDISLFSSLSQFIGDE